MVYSVALPRVIGEYLEYFRFKILSWTKLGSVSNSFYDGGVTGNFKNLVAKVAYYVAVLPRDCLGLKVS